MNKHSSGALRIAEAIAELEFGRFRVMRKTLNRTAWIDSVAGLIDREMHQRELVGALKYLVECSPCKNGCATQRAKTVIAMAEKDAS